MNSMARGKKYRPIWILITGVLLPVQFQLAQKPAPGERVLLFTDRDLYVVGEELRFKVHTLDAGTGGPVQYSDILYLELLDRQNSPLVREKFSIHEGESIGKLVLPFEMKSDHYLLRAYTGWMKNEGAACFAYQLIGVINPFEKIRPGTMLPDSRMDERGGTHTDPKNEPLGLNDLIIEIKSNPASFGTRERVHLEIETRNKAGIPVEASLSLGLVRKGLLAKRPLKIKPKPGMENRSRMGRYPPEWGGHVISGYLSDRTSGNRMAGDTLLFSLVGKRARLDYTVSDPNGRFTFLVKDVEGLQEVVIQHIDPLKTNCQIRLDDPFMDDFLEIQIPDFDIDTNQLPAINRAVINAQIYRLYGPDTSAERKVRGELSFYGIPEYRVMLDEYVRLPEMQEVFFELIPSAQMRGRAEQTTIRVRDKNTLLMFPSPPLMLVDGVVTREPSHIAGLDARQVERIDLVNGEYFFGMLYFPGILSVVTAGGNCPISLPAQVFRQSYDFISPAEASRFPDYHDETQKLSPLPDFRNTLYWDPSIPTDEKGQASVAFYTGDDRAEYTLLIRGITGDGLQGTYVDSLSVR
jgi:hypothetical protein